MNPTEEDLLRLIGRPDLNHCISCHEDHDEYGYSMTWLRTDAGEEIEVCCAVSLAYHEWRKDG